MMNTINAKYGILMGGLILFLSASVLSENDFSWKTGSPYPGINGTIYDTVVWEGNLVLGGLFDIAGDKNVSNIALWDGTTFHSLGGGMNGPVYALEVYESAPGNSWLVASGSFTSAGNTPVNNIARWSFGWHSLGSGLNGPVYALTVHKGNLYAGGDFNMLGGGSDIARWNADINFWETVFAAVYESTRVHHLISYKNELYAVIHYPKQSPNPTGIYQKWDFSTWVCWGLQDFIITDLKVIDNLLFAGGYSEDFFEDPEVGPHLVFHFEVLYSDGMGWNWHPVSNFLGQEYHDAKIKLIDYNGILFVRGRYYDLIQWDGEGKVDAPPYRSPQSDQSVLSVYNNQLICGSWKWNGSRWDPINEQGLYSINSFAVHNNKLVAIASNGNYSFFVEWNGHSDWQVVFEFPSPYGYGGSLSVHSDRILSTGTVASGLYCVTEWDGSSWQQFTDSVNGYIYTTIDYENTLIAGGTFTKAGTTIASRIAQWDGSSWLALGEGLNGTVYSSIIYKDNIVVGGVFECTDGIHTSIVARWDGLSWNPVGNNIDGYVDNFTIYKGDLIASGYLSIDGSPKRYSIARWDGSTWTLFGEGLNNSIRSLTVFNNELFVGGYFTQIGGINSPYLARWDGECWRTCGDSPNSYVNDLTVYNGELIVGGNFSKIGNSIASAFSRWGQSGWKIGDFNRDGVSSIEDLVHFCEQWLNSNCQQTGWCLEADLNYSNTVDLEDFVLFSENWNKSN